MKITNSARPARVGRVTKSSAAGKTATAKGARQAAAPSDKMVLAGVPVDELTPRARKALLELMQEVQTLRAELADAKSKLTDLVLLADRDPMLDIMNRRAFARELDRMLAMIDRYDARGSLVFVDLNDLKKINDSKGHRAGDLALETVSTVLTSNIRTTDTAGRLGGDEFGLLLTQADAEAATRKARDLAATVAKTPVPWKDGHFNISISTGVVEIPKGACAEETMERADAAMYAAKKNKQKAPAPS
ncbi:MAG: GGDEF domain-containing protein [Pseudomonadota bacterium]